MKLAKRKKLTKSLRQTRSRTRINRQGEFPRLSVHRSSKHIYAQIINDAKGKTLVAAHSREVKVKESEVLSKSKGKDQSKGIAIAFALGEIIAKKAAEKKINKVVFDRGAYAYHGRVKAVAEGARAAGLKI